MESFSSAANSFAAVGAADIAIRAATALYQTLLKSRDASSSIQKLLAELKTLSAVLSEIVGLLSTKAATSTLNGNDKLLDPLSSALNGCQASLDYLKTIVARRATSVNHAWIKQWGNRILFALEDVQIQDACRELERHKMALLMAMELFSLYKAPTVLHKIDMLT